MDAQREHGTAFATPRYQPDETSGQFENLVENDTQSGDLLGFVEILLTFAGNLL